MKSILVYGDSLVWGRNASNRDRHKYEDRWPNILGANLKNIKVWEAGLGGRTTDLNFPGLPGRNGLKYLPIALLQAAPLDLVILALGTNDPFAAANRKPQDTSNAMRSLIKVIKDPSIGGKGHLVHEYAMAVDAEMFFSHYQVGYKNLIKKNLQKQFLLLI